MLTSEITIKVPNVKLIAKKVRKDYLSAKLTAQYRTGNIAGAFLTYHKMKTL